MLYDLGIGQGVYCMGRSGSMNVVIGVHKSALGGVHAFACGYRQIIDLRFSSKFDFISVTEIPIHTGGL